MNIVILSGRLTRDAKITCTQGDKPTTIARFTLAVDRRYKREGQRTADFINCTAFGKTAEVVEKYTKQGTKLTVRGEWHTDDYTNKEGLKVYTNEMLVDLLEFGESKRPEQQETKTDEGGFMNIPEGIDEELPFN